jgi:hypothetical protein
MIYMNNLSIKVNNLILKTFSQIFMLQIELFNLIFFKCQHILNICPLNLRGLPSKRLILYNHMHLSHSLIINRILQAFH